MRSASNIARHELIGLRTKAVSDKGAPVRGSVIDESRNMLVIETDEGSRSIPKRNHRFTFEIPETGERVRVNGDILVARPEDRVKKRLDKW